MDPTATVIETAEAVRSGRVSATEVVRAAIERIEARNAGLNAWAHLDPDGALETAARIDRLVAAGRDPGPLAGVPIGVKDNEDVAGMPTTHGSVLYADRPPAAADAVHVARLRAAGAVPLGKTTLPEFGTLWFTRNKVTGVTRNPWDPDRTPGGSSGGSAAAVASGMVPAATANDGGGSTRIPAAFSGLVGFKPSFGRIPWPRGAESQTTVAGILVTTVADAARHLDVAAGPDDRDRCSLPPDAPPGGGYEAALGSVDLRGLRVLWSDDLGFAAVEPEVRRIARGALERLVEATGMVPVERTVTLTDPVRVWMTVGTVDLWQDLEPGMWPDRAGDLTRHVRRILEQTERHPVSRHAAAVARRWRLVEEVAELFADIDLLATPTTAVTAPPADGPRLPVVIDGTEVDPAMVVPFTMLANLTGNPAVSVPAGVAADGLPVGLQLVGRRHRDATVLAAAAAAEEVLAWPRLAPAWR